MTRRAQWSLDSVLFALVVVTAMSVSSQTTFGVATGWVVLLDGIAGVLFLVLPLLLAAVIRFNWLYRDWQSDAGTVAARSYYYKTAVVAGLAIAAMHRFVPSWTLAFAIAVVVLLAAVLTVFSPVRARGR
jgi:hypothetical protein